MTNRGILARLRWPLALAAAIVVTSIIQPDFGVAVLFGLVTVGLYVLWSRTRQRRSAWPQVASVAFSAAVLGLAGLFGLTTAYGTLGSIGLIDPPSQPSAEAVENTTASPDETATPSPAAVPTTKPTERPATPSPVPTPELGSEPTGETTSAEVIRVIDGDTIEVDIGGQLFSVRYIGIDTPETVHPTEPIEWMGPEASTANAALVEGQTVVLEKDVSEVDALNRLLRYVWLQEAGGWLLVNRELVAQGYALPSSYPPDVAYQDLFTDAAREARSDGTGLWGPTPSPVPTPPPTPVPTPVPPPVAPAPPPPPPPAANCHPSYSNVCLTPGIGDYDCSSGTGNGPNYVVGPVYVVGHDEYDLDRDGNGIGCENG